MGNSLSSRLKTNEMNPFAKGVLLVLGAYVVTAGIAVIIIMLVITTLILTDTTNCGTITTAIAVLGITIAAIFLTSVFVVRGAARKITPSSARRLVIVGVYGVALLVSYPIIAFGILVMFNC